MTKQTKTVSTCSRTQTGRCSSSVDEAEHNALVKAAAEGSGLVAGHDLGYEFSLLIWVSNTTVKAIATRLGLPEVRHMEASSAIRKCQPLVLLEPHSSVHELTSR